MCYVFQDFYIEKHFYRLDYYSLSESSKVTFQRFRFDGSKRSFSIVESIFLTDSFLLFHTDSSDLFNESIISLRFMHLARCAGNALRENGSRNIFVAL